MVSDLFRVGNERKIVAHIKEIGKAGFAPHWTTVCSTACRFAVELNLPRRFNNEEEMARRDRLTLPIFADCICYVYNVSIQQLVLYLQFLLRLLFFQNRFLKLIL
jgi:hypothetical protein